MFSPFQVLLSFYVRSLGHVLDDYFVTARDTSANPASIMTSLGGAVLKEGRQNLLDAS
ncbi:hypothetical protein CGRA01v4_05413 [Colletotrichum graminicola]|nr:hypothetical protein CGRA01v4_05413 [Colletotrichum graminicola]